MDNLTPEQQAYLDEMAEQLKAHWEKLFQLQKKYALPPGHLEARIRWVLDDENADMSEWYALMEDMGVLEYGELPEEVISNDKTD